MNWGDEVTPTEVRDKPVRVFWNAEPTSYYTLIMIGKNGHMIRFDLKNYSNIKCSTIQIRMHRAVNDLKIVRSNIGLLATYLAIMLVMATH